MKRFRALGWALASLVGVLLTVGTPTQAHAVDFDLIVSGDVNGVFKTSEGDDRDLGIGLAARLGLGFDTGTVRVTPEGMFEWDRFGEDDTVIRVLGGLRITGGEIFEPSVFAHVGWGRRNLNETDDNAVALDVGTAIDFTAIPYLKIGAQAAYNWLELDPVFDFVTFGAHITFLF